jgi:hypothetical protein
VNQRRRIEKLLLEAAALTRRARVPAALCYPTFEEYTEAATRGEIPLGVKVYIGWDPFELL